MLDWLIVGGGMHGMAIASRLLLERRARHERVAVLDPHDTPLARWRQRTAATGMRTLRSPASHHLDPEPGALVEFARRSGVAMRATTRPPLALFDSHCRAVLERSGADRLLLKGAARGLDRLASAWRVETGAGPLDAKRVVLALGGGDHPDWPTWARVLADRGADVNHVFEPDFAETSCPGSTVVLGGGLTAAQVALQHAARDSGETTLLTRHPLRIHELDADWTWFEPEAMVRYQATRDAGVRRVLLDRARHRGSVPAAVALAIAEAVRRGRLRLRIATVSRAHHDAPGVRLVLADGTSLRADRLTLATGLDRVRPGSPWLDEAARRLGLPLAPCGFPILAPTLRWAAGLFVTGALADLELGPTARAIAGGQRAAELVAHNG